MDRVDHFGRDLCAALDRGDGCSLLFVGYANIADAAIEPGVAALAEAVHAGH